MSEKELYHSKYSNLRQISSLISNNLSYIRNTEEDETKDYFSSKENALSAILSGYATLPEKYHDIFVSPLKDLFTNHFDRVLKDIKNTRSPLEKKFQIPFRDYIEAIDHRKDGLLKKEEHAFQVVIDDLYAGYLDMTSRIGIKPPDNQIVPPLPRFSIAGQYIGPYTVAANDTILHDYRIKMSIVTMGPAYAKNIVLWGALAHECAHDVTVADNGLLEECAQKVYSAIFSASELQGHAVIYNGISEPFAKRAAEVWKFWIYETVADIIGILNFGPASAIAFSSLVIPLKGGELSTRGKPDDSHPIDSLRIFMAGDLINEITSLNINIRNTWNNALLTITDNYISNKDKFSLGWDNPLRGFRPTVEFPFELMRLTTKIVAKTLCQGRLETLENHSLSEINTWADNDELISVRIADELIDNKEPSLESHEGETEVYPAHIISGAIYALMENTNISLITNLSISALSKYYDKHDTWNSYPLIDNDFQFHSFIPSFSLTDISTEETQKRIYKKKSTKQGKIIALILE